MVDPTQEDTEEKPLDPAVARIQARLQKLMLIAGLTLGLGILAVFLAIIYRIVASDDKAPVAVQSEPASVAAMAEGTESTTGDVPEFEAPPQQDAASEPEPEASPDAEAADLPDVELAEAGTSVDEPGPDSGTAPGESASAEAAPIPVPSPKLPPLGNPGAIETGSVPPGTDAAVLATKATVPADARLVASTVAGGRIVLTYDHFNGTILLVVDPETLKVVGRLDVEPR